MVLTPTAFCLAVLHRESPRSVAALTELALKEGLDLKDYDVRRALNTLSERGQVTHSFGRKTARLLYTLTKKGRNQAIRNRRQLRAIFGSLEAASKSAKKKTEAPVSTYNPDGPPPDDRTGGADA
jgi:DNA-binding MarR family transcriptional regulator